MRYKAFIFDMDGTIVHNMPVHNQAWQDTLAEAGVHIDQDEFNRQTTGKRTPEIVRLMLGSQLSEAEIAYWGERKETLYRQRFAGCGEPLPGLLEVLELAHQKALPMAVASAAPPDNVNFILDELDLRKYFQVVVNGEEVPRGKPDPEIFLRAAKSLQTEPCDCLVFEDALSGIEAARRAGMDAVFLTTTIPADETAGKTHVISAVPDFAHLDLAALF